MEEIKEGCYKGTRILLGDDKANYLQECRWALKRLGFQEIQIPIIQPSELFKGKVGEENNNMMFGVTERGGRDLCLAPEYTAVIQQLANTTFKNQKDVKLFYIAECFRGEKPQSGRWRQFTQLGVEILNPTNNTFRNWDYTDLIEIASGLIKTFTKKPINLKCDVQRGLEYYKDGKGFEITCDELGSSKQICGGGEYDSGVGFAIGVDRVMLLNK